MPSFSFKGFSTGSNVALSAVQGALSDSGAVSTWGQGSLSITTVAAGKITAPAGVWFEVTGVSGFAVGGPGSGEVYNPSFHEITYIWDFGDPGTFATALNMPTVWNNKNVAYGPKVAHTFDTPGTYTVSVWAVDANGVTGSASTTVTVVDADVVYPTTQTIVFSNDTNYSGAPTGAQQVSTISALQVAIDAASIPTRVLFKRGQSTLDVSFNLDNAYVYVEYFGAFGAGADPILTAKRGTHMFDLWNSTPIDQLTITGLDLRGHWESTAETGEPTPSPLRALYSQTSCHYTNHGLSLTGFKYLLASMSADLDSTNIVSDTSITNWQNYGIFCHPSSSAKLAIVGCSIAQDTEALNGGDISKSGLANDHGPVRIEAAKSIYIGASDFFSRNGWSGIPPSNADQSCIRLNTSTEQNLEGFIDRVACEGGGMSINLSGQNSSEIDYPGNYVIDKHLAVGSSKSWGAMMVSHAGGTTFRNVLGIIPNVPHYHTSNTMNTMISFNTNNPSTTPSNAAAEIAAYNCSFVNLRDATNDPTASMNVTSGTGEFNNVDVENNVTHGPNLDIPVTVDAPLDVSTTILGFSARFKGIRLNFTHESGTFDSDVTSSNGTFTIDYSEITDALYTEDGGSPTDQSYWTTNGRADHAIIVNGTYYEASQGDFSVSFDTSAVTITNTSGTTWSSGQFWQLRLDRQLAIPVMNSIWASTGQAIPVSAPLVNSAAYQDATVGRTAYDDVWGAVRTIPSRGAAEPS